MKSRKIIPVAEPALVGNEKNYVMDCLESTWISSTGKYIDQFERSFAEFCTVKHAIACSNGTVALHLALLALGVGQGDEVIIPTLTFVATANAVTYCGARPVFVDSEFGTWNIDPARVEEAITARTKAIIVVHLFGHPADMDLVLAIARKHKIFVIEDAAEAHGALYKGRKVGSIGDISTFSFYGNKIITTGEGGMVVTNDDALANTVRQFKGQGMDPHRRYWFPMIGFNYRMTNIAAAIGVAQLEKVQWHMSRRREVATQYIEILGGCSAVTLQLEQGWARSAYWMNSIVLNASVSMDRDTFIAKLGDCGVETRPFFYAMHTLPMYETLGNGNDFPVANRLAARGLNLPSSATLTEGDIKFVCDCIIDIIEQSGTTDSRLLLPSVRDAQALAKNS